MVSGLHSVSVILKLGQAMVGHADGHGLLFPKRCQGRNFVLEFDSHPDLLVVKLGSCDKV